MKTFTEQFIDIVKNIPKGKTMTYRQVAGLAGSPQATRAVGSIMAKNNDVSVPCHRVIRSDGTLGSYNGLRGKTKKSLLQQEKAIS